MMDGKDDLAELIQSAYASGDPNALLDLMNSSLGSARDDATASAGDTSDSRKDFNLNPSAAEFAPSHSNDKDLRNIDIPMFDDNPHYMGDYCGDDKAFQALQARFPRTDRGIIHALLSAHGGNFIAARSSLAELDALNALDEKPSLVSDDENNKLQIDTEGYAAAIAKWDSQFPEIKSDSKTEVRTSLIGTPSPSEYMACQHYTDGKLLRRAREHRLAQQFPWISPKVCSDVLTEFSGNSVAAEEVLAKRYQKPKNWDAESARKKSTGRQVSEYGSPAFSSRNDRMLDANDNGDQAGKWVSTGESVRGLYMAMREEARDEARKRNRFFEQAASAARAGKGAEAARLGALGRAANNIMKQLHYEAAELIWEHQNANIVRDGQIDLHALHVSEALERLPSALTRASKKLLKLKIITGTGHHSVGGAGVSRLKPAVAKFLQDHGYVFSEIRDPKTKHVGAFLVKLHT